MRFREAVLEVVNQFIGIIAEKDGGNAFFGRRDQYGAERGLAYSELDILIGTARAVLRGSHTKHIGRFFVEAPARIEAGVVNRFRNRAAGCQSMPDLRRAMGRGVFLGGDTRNGLKHAMEITRAEAGRLRQFLERRFFFALFDDAAYFRDKGGVFGLR
jgi:hypothetical protein